MTTPKNTLPTYWYTDKCPEVVKYLNKTYNQDWKWGSRYYWFDWSSGCSWTDCWDDPKDFENSPTYLTHSQFMEAIKPIEEKEVCPFVRGEKVMVSNNTYKGKESIFLADIEGAKDPYVCVNPIYKREFNNSGEFDVINWKYCKKIEQQEPVETTLDWKIALIDERQYTLSLVK